MFLIGVIKHIAIVVKNMCFIESKHAEIHNHHIRLIDM